MLIRPFSTYEYMDSCDEWAKTCDFINSPNPEQSILKGRTMFLHWCDFLFRTSPCCKILLTAPSQSPWQWCRTSRRPKRSRSAVCASRRELYADPICSWCPWSSSVVRKLPPCSGSHCWPYSNLPWWLWRRRLRWWHCGVAEEDAGWSEARRCHGGILIYVHPR